VEDETAAGEQILRHIYPRTGRAYVVGVTGPPGAGKSTLVDRLTSEIRRGGQTVGVIAVDPTSPFTGGAVLGDRVRMAAQSSDPGVFIRSMATRGHLGGLSRATSDAALVLDAAGKDVVIIETVGVGQDEVDIVRAADVSILTLVPGSGDEVQTLKAGIMEIADIFVVNKADYEGADRLVQAIVSSLTLHTFGPDDWRPPVLKTEATTAAGVAELLAAIVRYRDHSTATRAVRQRARQEYHLRELLAHGILERIKQAVPEPDFHRIVEAVAARHLDPYAAADQLMRRVLNPPGRGVPDTELL
jgi:LAO/AO transport system kinase